MGVGAVKRGEARALSDTVGRRVREERKARSLSAAQLAEMCKTVGYPELTTHAINNIETGRRDKDGKRRRAVSVDELAALAQGLEIPAEHLLATPSVVRVIDHEGLTWLVGGGRCEHPLTHRLHSLRLDQ